MENNNYCYMRISTKEERGVQKFSRQEGALTKYAERNGIEYVIEFKEDKSGKDFTHRKEWNRLERIIKKGDTIYFKDISRFTREAENGYHKYMELFNKGVNLVFLDNPTVSTDYIKKLLDVAQQQNLVARISLENTVKLLLIVELDRVEQERLTIQKRIKDGIAHSKKTQGRSKGQLDKMNDELKDDIVRYLGDRSIKQIDLMKKYNISRNTLKKYIKVVEESEVN